MRAGVVTRGCRLSKASERPWGARVGRRSDRNARGPAIVTNGSLSVTPYPRRGGRNEAGPHRAVTATVIRTTRPVGGRVVRQWR